MIFRPSAYAIIRHEDQILLLNMRRTGKLFLPGGSEIYERWEEALRREVREETSLKIEIERVVVFQEDFFYDDPAEFAFHGLMFFYLFRPLALQLANDDQIEDGGVERPRWVPIDQLGLEDVQCHGEIILATRQQTDLPD